MEAASAALNSLSSPLSAVRAERRAEGVDDPARCWRRRFGAGASGRAAAAAAPFPRARGRRAPGVVMSEGGAEGRESESIPSSVAAERGVARALLLRPDMTRKMRPRSRVTQPKWARLAWSTRVSQGGKRRYCLAARSTLKKTTYHEIQFAGPAAIGGPSKLPHRKEMDARSEIRHQAGLPCAMQCKDRDSQKEDQCPAKCASCGAFFNDSLVCPAPHFRRLSKTLFACDLCDATFASKMNMQEHVNREHTGAMPYFSRVCNRAFSRQTQRFAHEKSAHHKAHKDLFDNFSKKQATALMADIQREKASAAHQRIRALSASAEPIAPVALSASKKRAREESEAGPSWAAAIHLRLDAIERGKRSETAVLQRCVESVERLASATAAAAGSAVAHLPSATCAVCGEILDYVWFCPSKHWHFDAESERFRCDVPGCGATFDSSVQAIYHSTSHTAGAAER